MYCEVCKITCNGEKNFQQHLESAKHKKKKQLMPLIEQQKDSNGTSKNINSSLSSDNSISCVHCVKVFNTILEYQKHSDSTEHALMVLKNKSDSVQFKKFCDTTIKLSQPASEVSQMDSSVSSEPCSLHCETCDKDFTGPEPYEQHIESGKHKRKYSQLSVTKYESGDLESNSTNMLKCNICNIYLSGPIPYDQHLNGESHSKKLRKSLPSNKTDSKEEVAMKADSKEQHTPQKVTSFFCKECEVTCPGPEQYQQHKKGKKHTKKVALMAKLENPHSSQNLKTTATEEPCIRIAEPKKFENSNSSLDKSSESHMKIFKAGKSAELDHEVNSSEEENLSQSLEDELDEDGEVRDEEMVNQTLSSPTSSDQEANNHVEEYSSDGLQDELDEEDDNQCIDEGDEHTDVENNHIEDSDEDNESSDGENEQVDEDV